MVGRRHEIARMQSDFYKDWYHKILNILIGFSFIILFLTLIIIYLILAKPTQKYYATTTEGQIISLAPMRR